MSFIYNIGIHIYQIIILTASLFNKKAKQRVFGRKALFKKIKSTIKHNDKIVWFHCASLGEFEQGRTVIESFRQYHPEYKILLTFFSPSGYEIRKNYQGADYIFYLPIDTRTNAKKFIEIINPKMVFIIKYEFWFNYLSILYKKAIPTYIVSAIFRNDQYFFKWYGIWFRKRLKNITCIFVQDKDSKELLNSKGITNVLISGDTRFDRVYKLSQQKKSFPLIEQFQKNCKIFLAGSTWPADELLIMDLIDENIDNLKFIIAPHETNDERINSLLKQIKGKAIKYSDATEKNIKDAKILIIDYVGILSSLYQYSSIAYVGGGFGISIHNIQEPASFGKPILFGTNYHKFREAKDLINLCGAFSVKNSNELILKTQELLDNPELYKKTSAVCTNYINDKRGATEFIFSKLNLS